MARRLPIHSVTVANILALVAGNLQTAEPTITDHPQPQIVTGGGEASFTVRAIGALNYQWRRNGVDLVDGGSYSGTRAVTLRISGVRPYHAGTFDVVVRNDDGSVDSARATLSLSVISWPGHEPHQQIQDIAIEDGVAYAASVRGQEGLSILDVTDPMAIRMVGHWDENWVDAVMYDAPYVYLSTGSSLGAVRK